MGKYSAVKWLIGFAMLVVSLVAVTWIQAGRGTGAAGSGPNIRLAINTVLFPDDTVGTELALRRDLIDEIAARLSAFDPNNLAVIDSGGEAPATGDTSGPALARGADADYVLRLGLLGSGEFSAELVSNRDNNLRYEIRVDADTIPPSDIVFLVVSDVLAELRLR